MKSIKQLSDEGIPVVERIALLGGIAFAVLTLGAIVFFIANVVPYMAPLDASLEEHVAIYHSHGEALRLNNYMWVLPVPFFLLFLGGLYNILRRTEGESSTLSVTMFAAGVAMTVPWITNTAVETLALTIAKHGGDSATIWALDGLGPSGTMGLNGLARAVFLFATAFILLKSGIVSRWIGWVGMILALVNAIGSLIFVADVFFPAAWLSVPLTALWVLALSTALLLQARTGRQHSALEPARA
jgi:hypothetical protein